MEKTKYIYIWEGGGGCGACADMVGKEFEHERDINPAPPLHKNCQCYISAVEVDENGKAKPMDKDFHTALGKTMENEGGFTENTGRKDQPTNMGIKQDTLDSYNEKHPSFNFPKLVKDLSRDQAEQIYKMEFWDIGKFNEINNQRIRNALFDMYVMSGPSTFAEQLQGVLSEFGSPVEKDRIFGSRTRNAVNDIPPDKINDFMLEVINNRMDALSKSGRRWEENKNGWTARTWKY